MRKAEWIFVVVALIAGTLFTALTVHRVEGRIRAQAARRGDVPQFLSICHVLEFEPIYREEAKERKREHGGTAPGKHSVSIGDGVNEGGRFTKFMARDSAAGGNSVVRVLYIKAHDTAQEEDVQAPPEGSPYKWTFYSARWHCLKIRSWREVYHVVR